MKDRPARSHIEEVLQQMRVEGKTYWDDYEEYLTGTCKIYSYNTNKKSFWLTESDIIVGSFHNETPLSRQEMINILSQLSVHELKQAGFRI